MIISREYVTFRTLVASGDEGGKILMEKLRESYDESMWDEVWEKLADQYLHQREMSWAFYKIGDVLEAFERLDKEQPFDNGCTFENVNDVEIGYRDEESITLRLVSDTFGSRVIVKVLELTESKND